MVVRANGSTPPPISSSGTVRVCRPDIACLRADLKH
jgi:hypothetical protein